MFFPSATTACQQFQQGDLKPSELLMACSNRIEQRESVVKAWEFLAVESAQQQAIAQERQWTDLIARPGLKEQSLFGIPVAVKDIFATVDMPTTWGTPIYAGRYLNEDATVVAQLRAAGAIILGKTVTTELATAASGPTRNPHQLTHSPGGSSSGSAAAVADGMVPIAIGSQTMGSVLRPAAYCGIFGFKPSFGSISRQGMMPVCQDLDQVGFFARELEDLRLVFEVLADKRGRSPKNADGSAPKNKTTPLRLAWLPSPHWDQAELVAQTQLLKAVQVLEQAGVAIETVYLPPLFDDYWETVQRLCAYGLNENHGHLLESHPQQCSPMLKHWMEQGRQISSIAYAQAKEKGNQYWEHIAAIFNHYDAILTPVTTGSAPAGLDNTGSPIFCGLWTLCGTPAIALPLGKTSAGLPLGGQLVGACGNDHNLLNIATDCWSVLKPIFGDISIPASPS